MQHALSLLPGAATGATMTSREIAEAANKRHDHVLRDIDQLRDTLPPDLGDGIQSSTYTSGNPPRAYRQYLLNFEATVCLMAGYRPELRLRIIRRWQALERAQQAQPLPPTAPDLGTLPGGHHGDGRDLVATLLGLMLPIHPGRHSECMRVGRLLDIAVGRAPVREPSAARAHLVLAAHGLLAAPPVLLLANRHTRLAGLVARTPWAAGWRMSARTFPGAAAGPRAYFGGERQRSTALPLDAVLAVAMRPPAAAAPALPGPLPGAGSRGGNLAGPDPAGNTPEYLAAAHAALLRLHPRWEVLLRCRDAGLSAAQAAGALGVDLAQVRRDHAELAAVGLLPAAALPALPGGAA